MFNVNQLFNYFTPLHRILLATASTTICLNTLNLVIVLTHTSLLQ